MVNQLIIPEWQFVDVDGSPLSGGTIATYIPNTLTPKATYQDSDGLVANTNPIILDADGRCSAWGTGQVRCIVKDASGNLVYDQVSMAPLSDSAIGAILPCLAQPTLLGFRDCSGVSQAIADAVAGVTTLPGPTGPTGPAGPQGSQGPTGPTGQSAAVQSSMTNPGWILFGTLGTDPMIQFGFAASDSSGHSTVTFARPFASTTIAYLATPTMPDLWTSTFVSVTNGGFQLVTSSPTVGGLWLGGPAGYSWAVIGV